MCGLCVCVCVCVFRQMCAERAAWIAAAMAESPPVKRAKRDEELATVKLRARLPHMTQTALASLLRIAATQRLPEVMTTKNLRAGRRAYVRNVTPYGPVLQHIDAGNGPIAVQHPFAMLYRVCQTSERFSSLVKWAAMRHPLA